MPWLLGYGNTAFGPSDHSAFVDVRSLRLPSRCNQTMLVLAMGRGRVVKAGTSYDTYGLPVRARKLAIDGAG